MHFLQSRFCIRIWERGEYYLRDHTGKELAIYNLSTGRLKMLNLFGNGLIGRVNVIWDSVLTESDPGIWQYVYNRRDERNYYLKDHLGSIRLTVNESGNIITAQDYYPYGEILRSYTTGGNVNDKYKFTEKERDTETDYDYFPPGRTYDSKLVRWLQVDPLADKYPGWSPYNYTLCNPLLLIDPNGMEIDLSPAQKADQVNNTNYVTTLVNDLQELTGLSLTIDANGLLNYASDKNGAIVSLDANGNQVGSQTARDMLIGMVDNPNKLSVFITLNNGSRGELGGSNVGLDPNQINSFIKGTSSDLNNKTLGWGMVFLHESLHTSFGLSVADPKGFGKTGSIVDKMNIIRSEMGSNYGQRMSYEALRLKGASYLPFNLKSKIDLNSGKVPYSSYIKH